MANLLKSALATLLAVGAALSATGCDVPDTATGLVPEGPPKLRQVFLRELYDNAGILTVRSILAYGTHPNVLEANTHATTTAAVNTQTIRIVFDELLRGNNLEEIHCRTRQISDTEACVVPGDWSRVPIGATPDDIADCAVPNDLLDGSCHGQYATCLNERGVPCGIDDEDENGSADDTRLIAGQVKIICGDIEVPLNPDLSFWQPAGNQLVPARQSPEGSLGPALVLQPANSGRMPTGSTCRLVLAADVVDKDDISVCAPPGGDPTADCTPGDMSAFAFTTEVLKPSSSVPDPNATGVAVETTFISVFWNAALDPTTVTTTSVTVSPALPPPPAGMPAVQTVSMDGAIRINTTGPLLPATTYTVTITGVADSFGVPLPAPYTLTFTTI